MDSILDLLTPCTHHSELRVITAPPLISTLYRSLQHPLGLSQPSVSSTAPWQCLLTVEILQLPALRSSYHSRPCRTLISCQLLASLAELKCNAYPQFLNYPLSWPRILGADPTENSTFNSFSMVVGVSTDPLPRNGRLLIQSCSLFVSRCLPSNRSIRHDIKYISRIYVIWGHFWFCAHLKVTFRIVYSPRGILYSWYFINFSSFTLN
jgi:hypothetical protein